MKEYTDAGLEVWLRFAHEVKYVAVPFSTSRTELSVLTFVPV